ncbi:MAG: dihydrofolate reductase [Porphyromonas sp.]|nr:dihydrofolate reductase [Porphyromonas sp.]
MKTELHIIVAIADNGAIGLNGDMPWSRQLPADLKHFKETTMGHPIVMGRKTFESLPNGALKGRQNIIVTRNADYRAEGAEVVHSLEEAIERAEGDRLFLIGGGELYRQGMALADVLHITLVHHEWQEADTYFPDIDIEVWECVHNEPHPADEKNRYPYSFTTWRRKEKE